MMASIGKAAIVLASAAVSLSAAPGGIVQSYDSYRSWLVACDNTLTCVAKGLGGDSDGAEITIERPAGPNGALTASISATRRFGLEDVRIDGKPAGLAAPAWRLSASDDETSATSDDLVAVRALVRRLRNASKVTLAGDDAVPLDGFAAAMLRIDDRQGRSDGATALLKPGARPASHVPSPPPLPRIPDTPIHATLAAGEGVRLIAAVRRDQKAAFAKEECGETPERAEAYALDTGRALVFIPCIMGAYQGSSLAFIASRAGGPAQRMIAPTPYGGNDSDHANATLFTEPAFDPKTGTLSAAARGRAMADCGMSASWKWTGKAFRLSAMTLQQACGGVEPGDWPTIFRSRR